jgi:thiamine biosynthesis lipoprotein
MFFSRFRDPAQRRLQLGGGAAASRPAALPSGAGWQQREGVCMGTAITLQWWAPRPSEADATWAAVMAEMQRIDALYSPHKATSELSRINREAAHHAVAVSEETARLLAQAIELSSLTDGAFDITFAAAGHLYDYREGRAPDMATLRRARAAIGWEGLQLDLARGTLRFARPGMRIDLGGFAKGHAVDGAAAALGRLGVNHAWVAAGGDSRVIGDKRGRPWGVAIHDPRAGKLAEAGAAPIAVLPLVDCAVSTSGDYERSFVKDGVRHHHLLDPATGASATGARSVTLIADAAPHAGLVTEAWSKALFVLGPTRGLARLAEHAPSLDAVLVDANGRLHFSRGLAHAMPAEPAPAPARAVPALA